MSNLEFQMSEVSNDMLWNKMYDFFLLQLCLLHTFKYQNLVCWENKNCPYFLGVQFSIANYPPI